VARFWLSIALLSPLFAQEQPLTEGFRLLYQEHDYERANSVFQKIVRQTPGNAEAWRCLGRSSAALGRREDAITAIKRAIDLNPDHAETYVSLGLEYGALGQLEQQIDILNRAIRLNPLYVDAYDYLAHTYNKLGRHDEALKLAKQAITIKADDAEAYLVSGASYAETGQYEQGLNAVKQAIKLRPDDANAYSILGSIYQALERFQESVDALKQAVRLEPTDARAHYQLGVAYDALGLHDGGAAAFNEATVVLKRAIQIQNDFAEAYAALGVQYDRLGRSQDGVEACGRAVRLKPDYPYAHLCLGLASLKADQIAPAVEAYQALKGLDPGMGNVLSDAIVKFQALNGGKLTGERVSWSDRESGHYTLTLRNQLQESVRNVTCQVVFYDARGAVLERDRFRYEGVIPAGVSTRVSGKVDSRIHALASAGTPSGGFEVQVLDFEIAR
jgi:tetratricopeptide (TPR) repeat protein